MYRKLIKASLLLTYLTKCYSCGLICLILFFEHDLGSSQQQRYLLLLSTAIVWQTFCSWPEKSGQVFPLHAEI